MKPCLFDNYTLTLKQTTVKALSIVAVHGLNPRSNPEALHAWDTWRKPGGESGRLWLRDDLPKYTPKARIFLYEYNSALIYGGDKARFIDKANDLLEAIRGERKTNEERSLIFIGHSLGGILIEQALVNAHNNPKYSAIRRSTTGLVFFGTPHDGGDKSLVALGSAAARVATKLHVQPSSDIVEALKSGSLFSDILQEHWRQQLLSYQIISFWEGIGDVVPKKSAVFGLPGDRENIVMLNASHSDMCRFDESQQDQDNFKLVWSNIEDLYLEALKRSQYLKNEDSPDIKKVIQWISSIPYEQHHNTNKRDVLEGTGAWLFHEEAMIRWKGSNESSILWLHGIPGSGKTKLVSLVIDDIADSKDEHCLAYCYCTRNTAEPERAEPDQIARSLVRQMSRSKPRQQVLRVVAEAYQEREKNNFADGPLRLEESIELIIKLTSHYSITTIVIDALDECVEKTRHQLLESLINIIKKASGLVKVFVSSRDDKDIVLSLQDLPNLYIKASHNTDDIRKYVQIEVNQAIADKRLLDGNISEGLRNEVIRKLVDGAQGMFRWVSLQLQNLCSNRINFESELHDELKKLPKELKDIYFKIYQQILDSGSWSQSIAERSLKWILCCQRSLAVHEFLTAISVDFEETSIRVTKENVLHICHNLVIYDSELDIFRFAHLSVRDFLEERMITEANSLAAELCLLVCLSKTPGSSSDAANSFQRYAIWYWGFHCDMARERRSEGKLGNLLREFLGCDAGKISSFGNWTLLVKAAFPFRSHRHDAHDQKILRMTSSPPDPIFAACVLGFREIVQNLLRQRSRRRFRGVPRVLNSTSKILESLNADGETCLRLASAYGHHEVVQLLLLEKAATVNKAEGIFKETALHVAAKEGHEVVARLLLDNGAEINAKDLGGKMPLQKTAQAGHEAVARLLLNRGALVNAKDSYSATALLEAVEHGHNMVVQLLLDHGAEVRGSMALHKAACQGYETIARALCTTKDRLINAKDDGGNTALHLAASQGNREGNLGIVQLILNEDAEVDVKNCIGLTALHFAASCGSHVIVQLLLDRGAEIDAKDMDERTALRHAIQREHHEVMTRFLLNKGAEVRSEKTTSYHATVRLLLDRGAEINTKDAEESTALHSAVMQGHHEMVKLLLDRGAEINTKDAKGLTALHDAARQRNHGMMKLLLDYGADVRAGEDKALNLAISGRDKVGAKLLLDAGAVLDRGRMMNVWVYEYLIQRRYSPYD